MMGTGLVQANSLPEVQRQRTPLLGWGENAPPHPTLPMDKFQTRPPGMKEGFGESGGILPLRTQGHLIASPVLSVLLIWGVEQRS